MSVMSDTWIKDMVIKHDMITPFIDHLVKDGCISYGLSSYGYDVRVSNHFKIFTDVDSVIVDPKKFSDKSFVNRTLEECIIPPNSFVLATTVEWFKIPRDVMAFCVGKSTYARIGISVGCTPLEPEWSGQITLELANTTPIPAKVYANEGIAQVIFFKADKECSVSYKDRKGKYMNQIGVTPAKI